MGIYDRDYYRREGPSFLGSFIDRGKVCKWLIAINVIVFVIQMVAPRGSVEIAHDEETGAPHIVKGLSFTQALVLDPVEVRHGQVWRLLTYSFLHAGIWHILFNMLFLWWFGNEVEDLYGPKEFLAFYLASAFLGGLAFQLCAMLTGDPSSVLGASGAVTGIMVLYAFHYPARIIYVWFVPMPIWLFVAFQVLRDVFGFLGSSQDDASGIRTAFNVHLAGAAFAFAYYQLHLRVMNWVPDLSAWRRNQTRRRTKLRVYREEEPVRTPVAVAAPPPSVDLDEQLEAKLDAVLQKVSQSGRESLTESERQILVRASEIYKKKRS